MPFENFRESGAVAKFTFTDRLHLEVSAAVAKAKVYILIILCIAFYLLTELKREVALICVYCYCNLICQY